MMKNLSLFAFLVITLPVLAQSGNYNGTIKKADSLSKIKDYKAAAITYNTAFNQNKGKAEASDRYNAACVWALSGIPDSAFQNLNIIVGKYYFNYNHLTTDADLTTLHTDKRWPLLLDKIKKAKIKTYSQNQLYQDFDLLKSALEEAHTGLYWYNTKPAFDSICNAQRALIRSAESSLGFYNIIAPIIAFTKEGHTFLHPDAQTQAYLRFSSTYFPIYLKFLGKQPYIINDAEGHKMKGMILLAINGRSVDEIMKKFLSYEPADGYNTTSKYRWIEQNAKFSVYYSLCYPAAPNFDIEVLDLGSHQKKTIKHIAAISYDSLRKGYQETFKPFPNVIYASPATLKIDSISQTAVLTFNTFNSNRYKGAGFKFKDFVKESFKKIIQQKVKHLILDIRNNGGGTEGYEDYLLSYLIDKDYLKYKYVQASALHYSFYQYSDYKSDWQDLDKMLKNEHYQEKDGRILRKPGVEEHEKPQADPFKGDIYVLVGGLTYSGGSEFASLVKNHTTAVFIGEEVGGGYYGNTSGNRITLQLPNTGLEVGIPILKFVVDTPKDTVPFGHGLMPDYDVQPDISQFLNGYDAEMEYAKQLINKQK